MCPIHASSSIVAADVAVTADKIVDMCEGGIGWSVLTLGFGSRRRELSTSRHRSHTVPGCGKRGA